MSEPNSVAAGTFELPPAPSAGTASPRAVANGEAPLAGELLMANVLWFCRLRWLVIAVLAAFALVAWTPPLAGALYLRPNPIWPLAVAQALVLTNAGFLLWARRLGQTPTQASALAGLSVQILTDLLALTYVVHRMGSLESHVPFAYLFHVVLACIFLSRRQSLSVMLLACMLYTLCIVLEHTVLPPPGSIFVGTGVRAQYAAAPPAAALNFLTTLGMLAGVWYLASRLASIVRLRNSQLHVTNNRLLAAQKERSQHMLRTTHELKAPFAAIHANAQLMLEGYCGEMPGEAMAVARRISARCRRLAGEIQEMLQLANLDSSAQHPPEPRPVDLAETIRWCLSQVEAVTIERKVRVEAEISPTRILAVEDHVKMLLLNVVTNAVHYSHAGGRVRLTCSPQGDQGAAVAVSDEGIGIAPEKLPRIFEEYYRTGEALRHNAESSGLGLAIVKRVAQANGIGVSVRSHVNQGTTFELRFPLARPSRGETPEQEKEDGLLIDRG